MNASASTWTLSINQITLREDEAAVIQAFEERGIEASPAPGGGILLNTQHSSLDESQNQAIIEDVQAQTSCTINGNWTVTVNQ